MEEFKYNFVITSPIEIEETFGDRVIISGVVLKLNSVTGNGREYLVEEGEQIARSLQGMPIYYGAKKVIEPASSRVGYKHQKGEPYHVGRVFKTVFDRAKKVIRAWAEVWNTKRFPDLISRIKRGWGFSIGGAVKKFIPTGKINKYKNPIVKAIGMVANHLQLLSPDIPRGQQEAKVEEIKPIEETITFDPCPWGFCSITPEGIIMKEGEETFSVPMIEETLESNTTKINDKTKEEKNKMIKKKIIRNIIYTTDPDARIII